MTADKVCIVGCGLIGSQWAQLHAAAGHRVSLFDSSPSQAARCLQLSQSQLLQLEAAGQLRGRLSAAEQFALMSVAGSLASALDGALLAQESVFEDAEVKRQVFKEMEAAAPGSTILCSSSSCITASQFAAELATRSRCLVAHPVNPPYCVPLVEIVPAEFTDPQAVQTVRTVLLRLGQEPVVLRKELDGFVVNRLQYALICEAWRLVAAGAISAADVDKVMTHGLAGRYCALGPLAVMQTNADGIRDYCRRYGDAIVRVASTFGPTPSFNGEELEAVAAEVDAALPPESLPAARRRRDEFLAAIAQLRDASGK